MASAYYNEHEPYAAQWLRNLIAAGHIAPGDVDERSIEDVHPDDLRGYPQCHFFAGIGVWSHALRRAGWSDDRPVWTGSCPCQPFSAAGEGLGFDDERHLWPAWFHLVSQLQPAVLFGEQVASRDADAWIDLVQDDLEGLDYAVGAVPFPAAGVGAPHIRDRLYWMAYAKRAGLAQRKRVGGISGESPGTNTREAPERSGVYVSGMADAIVQQRQSGQSGISHEHDPVRRNQSAATPTGLRGDLRPDEANCFWRDADWLLCLDGRLRPAEPGAFPLAHGDTSRVGRLRAYGNAICAEAAVQFIQAAAEVMP